ncbi:hypothetical protein Sru01_35970 [Sphaerisporangium rufum]|uniref:Histidine kinase/HSP90-like ATPase domain-containing protein n=1 Tax=Sphaerisporangium rufum TaxID=1381558 RepID=A0A919V5S5_9ACTN|nr:ATP-binding protein [Sphaerisporangium rufum]GII78615.1 hypothetical protein Sru01_35970 [Sphaerisporangium rufum]
MPSERAGIVRLLGCRTSVARARQFTQDLLGRDHPAGDDVVLVVSELVTNSIVHSRSGTARGTVTLTIDDLDGIVRVAVTDDGSAQHAPRARDDLYAQGGRGLRIVNALAEEWGVSHHGATVTTWCQVPYKSGESPADPPGHAPRG